MCNVSRTTFLLALAALLAAALAALAAPDPAEVPTFQLRARVTSSTGKAPDGQTFTFNLEDQRTTTTGAAWSGWLTFGRAQIETVLKGYPAMYIPRYPVITTLTVYTIADPATVEVETRFSEDGPVSAYTASLFGPTIGLVLWRDDAGQARLKTMADYNQRYWEALKAVSVTDAERPKHFPIADRFIGRGEDRREWVEGIGNLARAGFNTLIVPADSRHKTLLNEAGLRWTASGVYNPPGYAFDFMPEKISGSTTPEAMEKWAHEQFDPFYKAGYKPEDLSLFAMSDEPGWYFPNILGTLNDSPTGLQHFRDYLKAQGLTPQDVGATTWEQVLPLGRSKATDLPARRLFYWTVRFFSWDSARHFANAVRALEKASRPGMPIFTNLNFFNGRLYFPGPFGNNPDKTSPDAAMGGHDWLEFGRMRAATLLWTEDWFSDAQAYQWSYYCAKLRCAAQKGGVQFGGYVIPRTAGDREDGILQKILTIAGSGGKALEYFFFGPEYNFPGNCYSENTKVLPKMAEAHRMIGRAEDLLWPGARPKPQVAILHPRSAELWDEKKVAITNEIVDCTNTNLNTATVDYMAEVFNLYVALQHADIPVDFVDEDDLSVKGLQPYKVLYVTEPNIPVEGQRGLLAWVKHGGTVVTVSGAGAADRYDDPCDVLGKGLGTLEQPRERMLMPNPGALKEAGKGTGPAGAFTAFGPRSVMTAPAKGVKAAFADDAPAMIARTVGRGRAVHFPWMPGLSYLKSSTTTKDRLPAGFSDVLRAMIAWPVTAAKVAPPVTVDRAMIETPLLLSENGAAVTLLNWTGEAQPRVTVAVKVPFAVKTVESVTQGKLAFTRAKGGIRCTLPLGAADILLLRP